MGIGGSATNDGGFGLEARALGWEFLERTGQLHHPLDRFDRADLPATAPPTSLGSGN